MSAAKVDHKVEAARLTAFAAEFDSIAAATSAAAHATLYAAEQSSRIADALELLVGEQGIMPVEIINGNELR